MDSFLSAYSQRPLHQLHSPDSDHQTDALESSMEADADDSQEAAETETLDDAESFMRVHAQQQTHSSAEPHTLTLSTRSSLSSSPPAAVSHSLSLPSSSPGHHRRSSSGATSCLSLSSLTSASAYLPSTAALRKESEEDFLSSYAAPASHAHSQAASAAPSRRSSDVHMHQQAMMQQRHQLAAFATPSKRHSGTHAGSFSSMHNARSPHSSTASPAAAHSSALPRSKPSLRTSQSTIVLSTHSPALRPLAQSLDAVMASETSSQHSARGSSCVAAAGGKDVKRASSLRMTRSTAALPPEDPFLGSYSSPSAGVPAMAVSAFVGGAAAASAAADRPGMGSRQGSATSSCSSHHSHHSAASTTFLANTPLLRISSKSSGSSSSTMESFVDPARPDQRLQIESMMQSWGGGGDDVRDQEQRRIERKTSVTPAAAAASIEASAQEKRCKSISLSRSPSSAAAVAAAVAAVPPHLPPPAPATSPTASELAQARERKQRLKEGMLQVRTKFRDVQQREESKEQPPIALSPSLHALAAAAASHALSDSLSSISLSVQSSVEIHTPIPCFVDAIPSPSDSPEAAKKSFDQIGAALAASSAAPGSNKKPLNGLNIALADAVVVESDVSVLSPRTVLASMQHPSAAAALAISVLPPSAATIVAGAQGSAFHPGLVRQGSLNAPVQTNDHNRTPPSSSDSLSPDLVAPCSLHTESAQGNGGGGAGGGGGGSVVPSPSNGLFRTYQEARARRLSNTGGPAPSLADVHGSPQAPASAEDDTDDHSATMPLTAPRFVYSSSVPLLAPPSPSQPLLHAPNSPGRANSGHSEVDDCTSETSTPHSSSQGGNNNLLFKRGRHLSRLSVDLSPSPSPPVLPLDVPDVDASSAAAAAAHDPFSPSSVRALAQAYLAALSRRSVQDLLALFAEEVDASSSLQLGSYDAYVGGGHSYGHSLASAAAANLLADSSPELYSPAIRRRWGIMDGHLRGRLALRKHFEKEMAGDGSAGASSNGIDASSPSFSLVALLAGASNKQWSVLYTRPALPQAHAVAFDAAANTPAADAAVLALAEGRSLVSESWELSSLGKLRCVRCFEL